MTKPDKHLSRISRAAELGRRGERRAARNALEQLWTEIGGEHGEALRRCAVAHVLADLQDDVNSELSWDLRALDAANSIPDGRARKASVGTSAAGLYPSLHLNLGDCYLRLGDLDRARDHVALGKAALCALPAGDYFELVGAALDRLTRQLQSFKDANQAGWDAWDRAGRISYRWVTPALAKHNAATRSGLGQGAGAGGTGL